jgi:hypothetical protein
LVHTIGVIHQRLPQQPDSDVDRDVANPEQDHARVGQPVAEDEVAKVFVIGQDDALFAVADL